MIRWQHYIQLMRLHQPIGIWLLLWPCYWSITLASPSFPDLNHLAWLLLGAVSMRAAGCIVNDLADRDIDRQVARTKLRPLASGAISPRAALVVLLLLLATGLLVAWQLEIIFASALCLIPVFIYPWMKRFTWWPQAFLGVTFNLGALLGWLVVAPAISPIALLLYIGCIFWTLGYDTIYAYQDIEDDARIGVRSTARYFGERGRWWVAGFYDGAITCWGIALWLAGAALPAWIALALVAVHLLGQVLRLDIKSPAVCLKLFRSNQWVGLIWWVGLLAPHFI